MILSNGFKNKTSSNGRHVQDFIEINCSFFNKEIMAHLRQNFYWRDLIFSSSSKIEEKKTMVVLLYPDISNFTFWNVKNLKCKIFLIDFLNELGNFKQKKFTLQNVNFLYILKQRTHYLAISPHFSSFCCKFSTYISQCTFLN